MQIEKNIPLPTSTQYSKYPFSKMDVGDSFAVPAEEESKVKTSGYNYASRNNMKISIRKTNNGQYRCWRVA